MLQNVFLVLGMAFIAVSLIGRPLVSIAMTDGDYDEVSYGFLQFLTSAFVLMGAALILFDLMR